MTVGHSLRFNLLVPDTEDGLLVLALDVVPLEAVVVHVIQDGHAAGIRCDYAFLRNTILITYLSCSHETQLAKTIYITL